jgi:hypothetical protein
LLKKRDTFRYLLLIINFYWNWAILINLNHEHIVFKFLKLLWSA